MRDQYVSTYLSGSRQKPRVMPGNGLRQTSSPTSPARISELPASSTTSIAIPSAGPPSEHALIGCTGVGERKHAPTSVPPEQLMIGPRDPPTFSNSQRYGSGFHGSPVVTNVRRDERSLVGSPCGMSARTSGGEMPREVTFSCSTVRQIRSAVGQSGAPSAKTIVPPSAPTPTTVHGPMIHPMSVAKWRTSPSCTSAWYATSRAIETRKPPCTCTTPFGLPVVPEVY